jgi:hypothetical protein
MTEVLVMIIVLPVNCVIVKMFNPARTRSTSFAFAHRWGFVEWRLIAVSPLVGVLTDSKK